MRPAKVFGRREAEPRVHELVVKIGILSQFAKIHLGRIGGVLCPEAVPLPRLRGVLRVHRRVRSEELRVAPAVRGFERRSRRRHGLRTRRGTGPIARTPEQVAAVVLIPAVTGLALRLGIRPRPVPRGPIRNVRGEASARVPRVDVSRRVHVPTDTDGHGTGIGLGERRVEVFVRQLAVDVHSERRVGAEIRKFHSRGLAVPDPLFLPDVLGEGIARVRAVAVTEEEVSPLRVGGVRLDASQPTVAAAPVGVAGSSKGEEIVRRGVWLRADVVAGALREEAVGGADVESGVEDGVVAHVRVMFSVHLGSRDAVHHRAALRVIPGVQRVVALVVGGERARERRGEEEDRDDGGDSGGSGRHGHGGAQRLAGSTHHPREERTRASERAKVSPPRNGRGPGWRRTGDQATAGSPRRVCGARAADTALPRTRRPEIPIRRVSGLGRRRAPGVVQRRRARQTQNAQAKPGHYCQLDAYLYVS